MKKTFFMIGILAALSMTAFGEDSNSTIIGLTGISLKPLSITGGKNIDFGKVVAGRTKVADPITLTLDGTDGENVKLATEFTEADGVTFVSGQEISEELFILGTNTKNVPFQLQYTAIADKILNGQLKITATYSDTAITQ